MGKLTILTKRGNILEKTCSSHKQAMITLSIEFYRVEEWKYETTENIIHTPRLL